MKLNKITKLFFMFFVAAALISCGDDKDEDQAKKGTESPSGFKVDGGLSFDFVNAKFDGKTVQLSKGASLVSASKSDLPDGSTKLNFNASFKAEGDSVTFTFYAKDKSFEGDAAGDVGVSVTFSVVDAPTTDDNASANVYADITYPGSDNNKLYAKFPFEAKGKNRASSGAADWVYELNDVTVTVNNAPGQEGSDYKPAVVEIKHKYGDADNDVATADSDLSLPAGLDASALNSAATFKQVGGNDDNVDDNFVKNLKGEAVGANCVPPTQPLTDTSTSGFVAIIQTAGSGGTPAVTDELAGKLAHFNSGAARNIACGNTANNFAASNFGEQTDVENAFVGTGKAFGFKAEAVGTGEVSLSKVEVEKAE